MSQYAPPLRQQWADAGSCPETLLLWFHHVAWDARLSSGRTLWEELCHRYDRGVAGIARMRATWRGLQGFVDGARFDHVAALLRIQEKEARWWRDACLLYFQSFSQRPFPPGVDEPAHSLEHYRNITHCFVPGSWPARPLDPAPAKD